jgi:FAD/FMN-containing dehydrogenase
MITRRDFLASSLAAYLASQLPIPTYASSVVNDIHSQLNATEVKDVLAPTTLEELQTALRTAKSAGTTFSIAGGRHAMGGQQFGTGTTLVDMRAMKQVLNFDRSTGKLEVEAGAFWPDLIKYYLQAQEKDAKPWGIAQKQTGADRLSIGGTLAANAHGRGLTMRPFISNVDSFKLINPQGDVVLCSRTENPELFRAVTGGYGLFGIVHSVTLQLIPRRRIKRVVEVRNSFGLMDSFRDRIQKSFLYGDFQFSIDKHSDDFLHRGVFSCYQPANEETTVQDHHKELSDESWRTLLYLAHTDQSRAFEEYSKYYLSTNGQLYWSDTHQLSIYPENYHQEIDRKMNAKFAGTEVITEINVPREDLEDFLAEVRKDFRKNDVQLIYGTIRLIETDEESFLPWAKKPYACTIFNLHTPHSPAGLKHSADTFRRLIDMAVRRNGTYYLTYHRHATRKQVLACYPEFPDVLRLKKKYDPQERFQSDWYRHYKKMFA